MKRIFVKGSIEKMFQVFIERGSDEVPRYIFDIEMGTGSAYDAYRTLEDLGAVEKTKCYDAEKKREVICYKLTEKGRVIVGHLKKLYEDLEKLDS